MKENEKRMFQRFQEECNHYLYEKCALKVLEKKFVEVNRSGVMYHSTPKREDPLKKYRLLQSHVQHVDHVFRELEKCYGSAVSQMIKKEMVEPHAVEEALEIAEAHQKSILKVLHMRSF